MSGFEVAKLYAKIVPKLADNFKSDLQRQINVATKSNANRATAKIGVEVSQGSLTAAKQKIESHLSKAKAQVKLDVDHASISRANKSLALLRNKTVKIKIELVGYALAKQRIDSLSNDQIKRIKVNQSGDRPGSGNAYDSKRLNGFAGSVDMLGRSFGRMSDLAGIAGVAVSGAAKIISTFAGAAAEAGKEGGSLASALGGIASSVGTGIAVAGVAASVLVLVGALAAGTLAAAGFAIAAVVLGAVVSAIAVAATAMAAAVTVATGVLSAFAGALGVVLLAILPVAAAFGEFMNVQGEAPKVTNTATKAISNQASAMRAANSAVRAAGRAVKDANKAVSDSAYNVVRAQRGVRDAGEDLKDSYSSLLKARLRLTQAERKAKENLIQMGRAARDAAGLEEDAEIRLIRAKERLAELNPLVDDQTDYREALRDVEQAERDLADQRQDNVKTQKEYEDAKKKGVNGDQDVIEAREGITEAERNYRDSKEKLLDAQRTENDARWEQTRAIDAQKESVERLKNAELDRSEVSKQTATGIDTNTAAGRKLHKQFGELTIAGQEFFNKLKEIYEWGKKLSEIAQNAFLPGLTQALTELEVLAPIAEAAVAKLGKTMGRLAVDFARVFTSEEGKAALTSLADSADHALGRIGDSVVNVTGILLPALADLAKSAQPIVDAFGEGFETIALGLEDLFKSLGKKESVEAMSAVVTSIANVIKMFLTSFGGFIEKISGTMKKIAPNISDGLGKMVDGLFDMVATLINSGLVDDFFTFIGDLGTTLSELSESGFFRELGATMGKALKVIGEGILDMMSNPDVLDSFIELFQIMPPLLKLFMDALPLLLPAFLDFITASSELVIAIGPDVIGTIVVALGTFAKAVELTVLVMKVVDKAIEATGKFIAWLADKISDYLVRYWQRGWSIIIQAVKVAWAILKIIFASLIDIIVSIGNYFIKLYNNAKENWSKVTSTIRGAVDTIKAFLGGLRDRIASVFDSIKDKLGSFATNAVAAFTRAKEGITSVWSKIQDATKKPVNFIIDPVYSNIRKIWNAVAGKVGLGALPEMKKFNQGGQLPGNSGMHYKDDRIAKTPHGPVALAGGEYIVNAPATRKYKDVLEQINNEGKRGAAVRGKNLGDIPGFGIGGFFGDLLDKAKSGIRGGLGALTDPAVSAIRKLLPNIDTGRQNFDDLIYNAPHKMLDGFQSFIKGDDKAHPPINGDMPAAGTGAIGGWKNMWNWIQSNFKGMQLYSSVRNTRTLSGKPSLHNQGRAIDITPRQDVVDSIISNFGKKSAEIISPWTNKNMWQGRPHSYSRAVQEQHGAFGRNAHIHWAMKNGGLVSGKGTGMSDEILKMLSNGEFVMNAKATAAIGAERLADANKMALGGASRRQIKANTNLSRVDMGSTNATPAVIDQRRFFDVSLNVQDDHQVDLTFNRINSMM